MIDYTSSNYKEATNLVFHLKRLILDGKIKQGSEIFLFMDNEVVEQTYLRELLHSSLLQQMIVGLRELEMSGDLIIHFI